MIKATFHLRKRINFQTSAQSICKVLRCLDSLKTSIKRMLDREIFYLVSLYQCGSCSLAEATKFFHFVAAYTKQTASHKTDTTVISNPNYKKKTVLSQILLCGNFDKCYLLSSICVQNQVIFIIYY